MSAVLVFMPAVLSGMLLVQVLWPDRTFWNLAFKSFLGVGVGLGLRSLLYFLYLLILPAQNAFIYLDLAFLGCMLIMAIARQQRQRPSWRPVPAFPSLTGTQRIFVLISGIVFVISLLSTANYLLRRRQGDWDAWMMYNRAARFVYFDQAHWMESFSPQMSPIFHADYPLLLAMNIVAGWEMLGRDSAAVPMLQSAFFAVACVGLATSALAAVKSVGQAALGLTLLWGIPVFVNEGARQMADVPMAFFVLATGTLLYLFVLHRGAGLLPLAGLTTGLAAWTKNEGSVLVVGAFAAVVVLGFALQDQWRTMIRFAAGLAVPLAVVLLFKLFLAPSGDIVSAAAGGSLSQMGDGSRHTLILQYLWSEIRGFGSWRIPMLGIGILPVLALYAVIFRSPVRPELRLAYRAGITMLVIQLLGYYAAYLVSPYDLAWHLSYSSGRVVLQLFPLLLFLTLCASLEAEYILAPGRLPATE
ncbi:MAG: hypothetical protein V1755_12415 [Chloroflexota bacterium]